MPDLRERSLRLDLDLDRAQREVASRDVDVHHHQLIWLGPRRGSDRQLEPALFRPRRARSLELEAGAGPGEDRAQAGCDEAASSESLPIARSHVARSLRPIPPSAVNNGVVLLSGKADSMTDHLEALSVAGKVAGVRRVESEIKAENRLSDASSTTPTAVKDRAHGALAGAGSSANDLWITSAAKMRLLADRSTPALDINVDTQDRVVTLFGIVPTAAAKSAAEANVRKVDGVKSVRNELQVVPAAKRAAIDAKDADIERGVEKTLAQSAERDKQSIDVDVKDGMVRLTGSAASEDDRLAAGFAARSIPGVRAVLVDDLQVKS